MRTAAPIVLALLLAACASGPISDPQGVLATPDALPTQHVRAMEQLDAAPTPEYIRQLKSIVVSTGYVQQIREEAFDRLYRLDKPALEEAIEVNLARMTALEWRRTLCQRIAEMRWNALVPALIRAWATPVPGWDDKPKERPERLALVALYGEDGLVPELFRTMNDPAVRQQENLRMRCWELLVAQGQEERLLAELRGTEPAKGDALMRELRSGVLDLGILPRNKEEILWMRALVQPSRAAFLARAKNALAKLPDATRRSLEVREVPVAMAVVEGWPELASRTKEELFEQVRATIKPSRHAPNFDGFEGKFSETLYDQRDRLTWGDCALILVLHRAFESPQLRGHLFEMGDRDVNDRGTEYGGILRLDDQGRIEAVEFTPRVRGSDVRFEASKEMFEAGYTGLSHFHFHAQSYDNGRYAGPHIGDFTYADATGVNGIVLCFIDSTTLNVDVYRRGRVVIDMGTIRRP
jgi:hypothetical protein